MDEGRRMEPSFIVIVKSSVNVSLRCVSRLVIWSCGWPREELSYAARDWLEIVKEFCAKHSGASKESAVAERICARMLRIELITSSLSLASLPSDLTGCEWLGTYASEEILLVLHAVERLRCRQNAALKTLQRYCLRERFLPDCIPKAMQRESLH